MVERRLSPLGLVAVLLAILFMGQQVGVTGAQTGAGATNRILLPLVSVPDAPGTPGESATPIAVPPGAHVIHVAPSGSDASDCGGPSNPCRSLQRAIDAANGGGAEQAFVKVAQGTYTGSGKAVAVLNDTEAITFVGGFLPPDWDASFINPANTIVDGQNARRGFFVYNTDGLTTIRGITIQNGLLTDGLLFDPDSYMGGGLACAHASVSLSDVAVRNNAVRRAVGNDSVGGGGVALYYACPATLHNVVFDNNRVLAGNAPDGSRGGMALGGGLFATSGSSITASNLTFTNNQAIAGSGGAGQASNGWRADGLGGAAALQFDTYVIDGFTATGNRATAGAGAQYGGFGAGGALFFEGSNATLKNGVLRDNVVVGGASPAGQGGTSGGGAVMATDSTILMDRVSMLRNSSIGGAGADGGDAGGGALYFTDHPGNDYQSRVTGTNLIIADNYGEAGAGANRWGGGGAIFSQNTELTLTHSTIAGNRVLSTMFAPAIVVLSYSGGSTLNLSYSIVANHEAATTPNAISAISDYDVVNLDYVLYYNNAGTVGLQDGSVMNNRNPVPSADPRFVSPGAPNYDYHIAADSAAIGRAAGSSTPDDVDGQNRLGGTADLGADEFTP